MDTPCVELQRASTQNSNATGSAEAKRKDGATTRGSFWQACTQTPGTKPRTATPTTPSIHDDISTTTVTT
eukprot:5444838-Pyramimonas_sp.AAC.1